MTFKMKTRKQKKINNFGAKLQKIDILLFNLNSRAFHSNKPALAPTTSAPSQVNINSPAPLDEYLISWANQCCVIGIALTQQHVQRFWLNSSAFSTFSLVVVCVNYVCEYLYSWIMCVARNIVNANVGCVNSIMHRCRPEQL